MEKGDKVLIEFEENEEGNQIAFTYEKCSHQLHKTPTGHLMLPKLSSLIEGHPLAMHSSAPL